MQAVLQPKKQIYHVAYLGNQLPDGIFVADIPSLSLLQRQCTAVLRHDVSQ
jgi:hypothetical protein